MIAYEEQTEEINGIMCPIDPAEREQCEGCQ